MNRELPRLLKRKAKLEEEIRKAEEREVNAERTRRATEQAKYILGGLAMARDAAFLVPANLCAEAARRRPSDEAGWGVIAAHWRFELPPQPTAGESPEEYAARTAVDPHQTQTLEDLL